jgi:hypothetical protein
MRRVGSDSALDSTADLSGELLQDEPASELLTQTCDPAKFSVYYQLGVSVDHDESGLGDGGSKVEEAHLIADSVKCTTLDDSIQQCSLSNSSSSLLSPSKKKNKNKKLTPAQCEEAGTKKKNKKKRGNSWRRVLLLHRAVHNMSRSDDKTSTTNATAPATTTTPTNNRRLKSESQSCCALQ